MPAQKEVYLTPEPQPYMRGDGTLWNPIDCSTRQKFDTTMSGIAENTVINLLPGTFYTAGRKETGTDRFGEFYPKSGWYVKGAGIGKTIIKLDIKQDDDIIANEYYGIFLSKWGGDETKERNHSDITISDLTFDLSASTISQVISTSAVTIIGDRNTIRNCEIINWGTSSASKQSFLIRLDAQRHHAELGVTKTGQWTLIENNIIHKPYKSTLGSAFTTAITCVAGVFGTPPNHMSQKHGYVVVKNNIIDGTVSETTNTNYSNQNFRGVYASSCVDVLMYKNNITNAREGFNHAAYKINKLNIEQNKFWNVRYPIYLQYGAYSSLYEILDDGVQEAFTKAKIIIIQNNDIQLIDPNIASSMGISILCSQRSHYQDGGWNANQFGWVCERFICDNNSVSWAKKYPSDKPVGDKDIGFISMSNVSGVHVTRNTVNLPLNNGALLNKSGVIFINSRYHGSGCSGAWFKDNSCTIWDWETAIASGDLTVNEMTPRWSQTGRYILPNNNW